MCLFGSEELDDILRFISNIEPLQGVSCPFLKLLFDFTSSNVPNYLLQVRMRVSRYHNDSTGRQEVKDDIALLTEGVCLSPRCYKDRPPDGGPLIPELRAILRSRYLEAAGPRQFNLEATNDSPCS